MKVLIIGGGGIGSWLIARLARLRDYNQLNGLDALVVADDDEIEDKNLPYQNFELDEIMDSKALALDARYGYTGKEMRITTHEHLEPFDMIVCAVDNPKARRLVYEHCSTRPNKYFIDLRAEGSAVWGITSDAGWNLEQLKDTLGDEDADDKSCQLEYELSAGIIQLGNTIIAEIGAQWILNKLRNKKNPAVFSQRF
ncbi:MAG: ThiF family adenylyltransferase [Candidatus Brocadiales bacterium]|nr:ThiF family adenylyltransferase [Candidatus Brocadiales bacterium]